MHPSSEFILGGQRSGKSRCGERRAAGWLAGGAARRAVLLATAQAGDGEMRERIAHHRRDRAARVPAMATDEDTLDLAAAVARHAAPDTLVLVDCLTLWTTRWLMPLDGRPAADAAWQAACGALDRALRDAAGPVVLVSNEIGLGLAPLSAEARAFVDALGRLHQQVAARCPRVTLMVAGLEMAVRREGGA
jgi:adenosylcobinamide kinase/adenosylcobinamide-phosphate guanylyltransferase